MKLEEAVKSGKPFKLPDEKSWKMLDKESGHAVYIGGDLNKCPYLIDWNDIFSEDWEVKEDRISITKQELMELWDKCQKNVIERPTYHRDYPGTLAEHIHEAMHLFFARLEDDFIEKESSLDK